MYVGQHAHKNSMNQYNEKLVRIILIAIQDYFYEYSNSTIESGSPYVNLNDGVFAKDSYILKMTFLGEFQGFVLLTFSAEMMKDIVKEDADESITFDEPNTVKQLCQFKIHKMSQSIRKKLMKSLEKDTFISVAIASTYKETELDMKPITIPLFWRKHEFNCQFFL